MTFSGGVPAASISVSPLDGGSQQVVSFLDFENNFINISGIVICTIERFGSC